MKNVKNRLATQDRLSQLGYNGGSMCLFCCRVMENSDHLFFKCSFTGRICTEVMRCSLMSDPKISYDEVVSWGLHSSKVTSFRALSCKLSWHAVECITFGFEGMQQAYFLSGNLTLKAEFC